jgi:phosphoglucomutase
MFGELKCVGIENFMYVDPHDRRVTLDQGMILRFESGERVVFRLSGTGTEGSTIRIYLESFESREHLLLQPTCDVLRKVSAAALEAADIVNLTGRKKPTVVT